MNWLARLIGDANAVRRGRVGRRIARRTARFILMADALMFDTVEDDG